MQQRAGALDIRVSRRDRAHAASCMPVWLVLLGLQLQVLLLRVLRWLLRGAAGCLHLVQLLLERLACDGTKQRLRRTGGTGVEGRGVTKRMQQICLDQVQTAAHCWHHAVDHGIVHDAAKAASCCGLRRALCPSALHLTAISPSHPPLPLSLPTLPDEETSTSWWRCSMASLTLSAS